MKEIEKLYDLYSKDVYRFIYSLSFDEEIAKDIMQITFLECIKSIKNFKGNCSEKTWLLAIEYNEVLKAIHSLKEPQRQIMILRLINDFTFKEIGEILGKSENYCRVNFFREKKKLVKQFKD